MRERDMQVIFQSQNGDGGKWLDYCREAAPSGKTQAEVEVWANDWCKALERRVGCEFRFKIELW